MAARAERIYDELLCFLGDPIFQIPVRTFMDENCLIFDPSIKPGAEHEEVHTKYKKLIDTLLDGFCQDAKITIDDAIKGINKLSQVPDLREVFHTLFEQVMAATDFQIFAQVMIKRNIMIQEQVLVMIIAATGGLPDSLQVAKGGIQGPPARTGAKAPPRPGTDDRQEEDILKQVMEKSKRDEDVANKQRLQEDKVLQKTLALSKNEALVLQTERLKIQEDMNTLAMAGGVGGSAAIAAGATQAAPRSQPAPNRLKQEVQVPDSVASSKAISGSEAANQWLASAQAESGSSTHSAIAASLSGLSQEELAKRQDFLRQQRDKLLIMKKEARQKQLGQAEKDRPSRPQSARAARAAMTTQGQADASSGVSAEDEKKMAMRRAIAEKLRAEVIGKN